MEETIFEKELNKVWADKRSAQKKSSKNFKTNIYTKNQYYIELLFLSDVEKEFYKKETERLNKIKSLEEELVLLLSEQETKKDEISLGVVEYKHQNITAKIEKLLTAS
jgi:hypothetical protein